MNFRQFMKEVRKHTPIRPVRLRKVEKYTGKPYKAGISDMPAWKGKDAHGEAVYATLDLGDSDLWTISCGDWAIGFERTTGRLAYLYKPAENN